MDSVSSVSVFSENIQTTQPSLTKRGLALQGKNDNPASGSRKVTIPETAPPPQTPQKQAIDIKV